MSSPDHERACRLAAYYTGIGPGDGIEEEHNLSRAYLARTAEVKRLREELDRIERGTGIGCSPNWAMTFANRTARAALAEGAEASDG